MRTWTGKLSCLKLLSLSEQLVLTQNQITLALLRRGRNWGWKAISSLSRKAKISSIWGNMMKILQQLRFPRLRVEWLKFRKLSSLGDRVREPIRSEAWICLERKKSHWIYETVKLFLSMWESSSIWPMQGFGNPIKTRFRTEILEEPRKDLLK